MSDSHATTAPATAKTRPARRQKVPPFARYKGTSAWRKDKKKVRAYAMFLAAEKAASSAQA